MPRAEFGTPKWLSNRMKSKGLQRLRWFCQMCQKQCRDENGFKCHCMSEGHRRQMQIFAQRPGKYISEFSRQFEAAFMRLVRTRYSRARVLANTVYCEMISDKNHVHMNSTTWTTLSEFIWYLKRSGKIEVEYSDEGWYIQYVDYGRIDLDERAEAKRREEVNAEQCRARIMNELIKNAWEGVSETPKDVKALDKEKLYQTQIKISAKQKTEEIKPVKSPQPPSTFTNNLDDDSVDISLPETTLQNKREFTALEQLILDQEKKKKRKLSRITKEITPAYRLSSSLERNYEISESEIDESEESDSESDEEIPWVEPNLIVKVNCEDLFDGKYHGLKGRIVEVKEEYLAEVEILKSKSMVLLDQSMLQQVLPIRDGWVKIIAGKRKGEVGTVSLVDIDNEIMRIKLNNDSFHDFPFSALCKYIPESSS